jgi:aspartyl-tRNA(Asn)/glutamyl-tRNA(Gln) amidotransferase subunit C
MVPPADFRCTDAVASRVLTRILAAGTMRAAGLERTDGVPEKDAAGQSDVITKQVFDHLVDLAQFELSEDEAEYLRRELNGQMESIRQLGAIDIDGDVPITTHGVPYRPGTRPSPRSDEIEASGLADAILEAAPEREDRYIVVPDIPHEALE